MDFVVSSISIVGADKKLKQLVKTERTSWEDRYLGRRVDRKRFDELFPNGEYHIKWHVELEGITCYMTVTIDGDDRIDYIDIVKSQDLTDGHGRPASCEKRVTADDRKCFADALEIVLVEAGEKAAKANVALRKKLYAEQNQFIDSVVPGFAKLVEAVGNGNAEEVHKLSRYVPISLAPNPIGDPLVIAAEVGNREIFDFLLAHGAVFVADYGKVLKALCRRRDYEFIAKVLDALPAAKLHADDIHELNWSDVQRLLTLPRASIMWNYQSFVAAADNDEKVARGIFDCSLGRSDFWLRDYLASIAGKGDYESAKSKALSLGYFHGRSDRRPEAGVRATLIDKVVGRCDAHPDEREKIESFIRFVLDHLPKWDRMTLHWSAMELARHCSEEVCLAAVSRCARDTLVHGDRAEVVCRAFASGGKTKALAAFINARKHLHRNLPYEDTFAAFLRKMLIDAIEEFLYAKDPASNVGGEKKQRCKQTTELVAALDQILGRPVLLRALRQPRRSGGYYISETGIAKAIDVVING